MRWMALVLVAYMAGCDDEGADAASADAGLGDVEVPAAPSPEVLADQVDLAGYAADLELIARPRPPGSAHWQVVQDRCAEVFAEAGFVVERHDYGSGVNVVGVRPGTTRPNEWVVVSGHYDHIEACSGADDNASGAAGVLAAARALGNTAFERTLAVACWDEEEWGLVGSTEWVARAQRQGVEVKASYVLESMGYFSDEPGSQALPFGFDQLFVEAGRFVADRDFRGDFVAAITDDIEPSTRADFSAGAERVGLPVAQVVVEAAFRSDNSVGDLRRSDHDPFWQAGWPAIQLTCSANFRNPHYHCTLGEDDIAEVDLERALKVVQATIFAAARQAGPTTGMGGALDTTTDPAPPSAACDLIAQDCPEGQKCGFTRTDGVFGHRCLPAGALALGAACTRGPGGPGDDACGVGGYCSFFSQPLADPQGRICQAFCLSEADCPADEVCAEIDRSHHVGVCTAACDPLDAAACGEGQICVDRNAAHPGTRVAVCQPGAVGTATRGEDCGADGLCAPGLECLPEMASRPAQCQPWCATDADCGEGSRCQPRGIPDRGVCVP